VLGHSAINFVFIKRKKAIVDCKQLHFWVNYAFKSSHPVKKEHMCSKQPICVLAIAGGLWEKRQHTNLAYVAPLVKTFFGYHHC